MSTHVHLTFAISDLRAHHDEEQVRLRNVELARQDARRSRRAARSSLVGRGRR